MPLCKAELKPEPQVPPELVNAWINAHDAETKAYWGKDPQLVYDLMDKVIEFIQVCIKYAPESAAPLQSNIRAIERKRNIVAEYFQNEQSLQGFIDWIDRGLNAAHMQVSLAIGVPSMYWHKYRNGPSVPQGNPVLRDLWKSRSYRWLRKNRSATTNAKTPTIRTFIA